MSSAPNDSYVAEERAKYAKDLVEPPQCPICPVRPNGPVRTCKVGHHLCEACWGSLRECPTCKTPFSPGDGHSSPAEELRSKWDEFSLELAPPPMLSRERTIDCRIGFCLTCLPTEKMTDHVRNVHASSLLKTEQSEAGRFVELHLAYETYRLYSYALEAEELGMFFFVVFIDQNGDAHMEIQVAYSCPGIERFKYLIYVHHPDDMFNSCDESYCAFGDEEGSHVYKVEKHEFVYYYKDGGILDEKKKEPFTVMVQIEK